MDHAAHLLSGPRAAGLHFVVQNKRYKGPKKKILFHYRDTRAEDTFDLVTGLPLEPSQRRHRSWFTSEVSPLSVSYLCLSTFARFVLRLPNTNRQGTVKAKINFNGHQQQVKSLQMNTGNHTNDHHAPVESSSNVYGCNNSVCKRLQDRFARYRKHHNEQKERYIGKLKQLTEIEKEKSAKLHKMFLEKSSSSRRCEKRKSCNPVGKIDTLPQPKKHKADENNPQQMLSPLQFADASQNPHLFTSHSPCQTQSPPSFSQIPHVQPVQYINAATAEPSLSPNHGQLYQPHIQQTVDFPDGEFNTLISNSFTPLQNQDIPDIASSTEFSLTGSDHDVDSNILFFKEFTDQFSFPVDQDISNLLT